MKARILATCIVWAIAAVVLQGQVSVTFGPQPVAPQGCLVCGTISNDTASSIGLPTPCPMVVKTLGGALVWAPICIQVPVIIPPGGTFVAVWPQVDDFNNQVAQGQYQLELTVPALGVVTQVVQIVGPGEAAISALGAPRTGTNRPYVICSPSSPNLPYVMAASTSQSPGIPLCPGVTVPLAIDPLFLLSQQPVNPFFTNFWGTLDNTGHTAQGFDPLINIPNVPGLIGFQFQVAAIAFDPFNTVCPFKVTYPFTVTIQ